MDEFWEFDWNLDGQFAHPFSDLTVRIVPSTFWECGLAPNTDPDKEHLLPVTGQVTINNKDLALDRRSIGRNFGRRVPFRIRRADGTIKARGYSVIDLDRLGAFLSVRLGDINDAELYNDFDFEPIINPSNLVVPLFTRAQPPRISEVVARIPIPTQASFDEAEVGVVVHQVSVQRNNVAYQTANLYSFIEDVARYINGRALMNETGTLILQGIESKLRADAQAGITYPVLDNNTLDRTRRVAFNTQPEKARNAVTPRAIIAERVPRQGRHTLNVTVPEGEEDGTARTSIFDITADFGSRFSVYPSALGFEWDGVGDPDFLRPYLPDDITASIRSDNEDAVLTFVSRHPVRWRIEGVPLTATLINARGQEYDLLPNATDRGYASINEYGRKPYTLPPWFPLGEYNGARLILRRIREPHQLFRFETPVRGSAQHEHWVNNILRIGNYVDLRVSGENYRNPTHTDLDGNTTENTIHQVVKVKEEAGYGTIGVKTVWLLEAFAPPPPPVFTWGITRWGEHVWGQDISDRPFTFGVSAFGGRDAFG